MLKRIKLFLALLAVMLLLLLCAACAKTEQIYTLPPTQEQVEQLLSKHKLDWQIENAISSPDGSAISFTLANADGATGLLSCKDMNGERGVNLGLMLQSDWMLTHDFNAEQSRRFLEQEWPHWHELVAALYGGGREAAKAYEEFTALAQNKEATMDSVVNLDKLVGENNYNVHMQAFGSGDVYNTYGMQMVNTAAYRQNILFRVLTNMAQVGYSGVPGEPRVVIEVPDCSSSFTAAAYEKFAASDLPLLWQDALASINHIKLELESSVDVNDTQQKNFSLTVMYYADEANIYGYAQFSKDNLLTDFSITDDSELQALLP